MLRHLKARRFRNLAPLDLDPVAGLQLLLGGTGAGKTSVLEAVYVVCTTRSFRTSRLQECVRASSTGEPETGFALAAEIETSRRDRLEVAWSEEGGLVRRVDGSRSELSDHVGVQPALVWSSADVEMVSGSPALRRRFLDRGILAASPRRLAIYSRYRKALGEKRALLRRGSGVAGGALESWNEVLAVAAAELVAERRRYVQRLAQSLEPVAAASGLDFADLALHYVPSPAGVGEVGAILEALERAARREVEHRRPLIGPHRDRLRLRWRGTDLERIASAGERKAAGMLLLAAQVETLLESGREPVVLIDDLDTELDRATLRGVCKVLERCPQLIASSNRPEVFEEVSPAAVWRVRDGVVEGA